jgi:hypothetical protein
MCRPDAEVSNEIKAAEMLKVKYYSLPTTIYKLL